MIVEFGGDNARLRRSAQDSKRITEDYTSSVKVSTDAMRRFLQQTNGDLRAAGRLALQEMQQLKRQAEETDRVVARVLRRREGPALPPGGLVRPSGPNGPFSTPFGGVQGLPAMARPEAARGFSRTQGAALALAFTLGNLGEQLAAADTKWQKLDRVIGTAAQTIASVAVFFGPGGMLVAGVAVAANALSSFWTQQREEAERTAKAWEESLARMRKGRDLGGAAGVAQETYSGAGGVQDLSAQIQRQRAVIAKAERELSGALLQSARQLAMDKIHELDRELAVVNGRHKEAIGIVNELAKLEGERAQTALKIAAWEASKEAPAKRLGELVQQTQSLISLEKALADAHMGSADVTNRIVDNYRALNAQLDAMPVKWTAQAVVVRQLIAEIDASPLGALMRGEGAIPGVGTTPSAPKPMPIPKIEIPAIERLPVTLGQQIRVALQPMIDVLRTMSSYLLNAGLSMLSQYGGRGGQQIAGVISGAVAGAQIGGAAGAVVGGLVGVVDALFSSARAAKEARRAFQEFLNVQGQFLEQQRLALGDLTQSQFDVIQLQRSFAAQRAPIEQRLREVDKMVATTPDSFGQRDRLLAEQAQLRTRLNELNDLERRRLKQLGEEADALNQMTEAAEQFRNVPSWFKVNLEVWRAANAVGPTVSRGSRDRRGQHRRPGVTDDSSVISIGSITIGTRATNGRQLVAELIAELKRQGLATFGAGQEARILAQF